MKEEKLTDKLDKLVRLVHIRAEKQVMNKPIEIELDTEIAQLKSEIGEALWRLESLMD